MYLNLYDIRSIFTQYFYFIRLDFIITNTLLCPDRNQKMPMWPWLWVRPWQQCVHVNTSLLIVIFTPGPPRRPAGVQRLPSLSLPWECEQACGIESQQPIPALIAQRQACGTWQRCPMRDARHHKPQQPCLLRCSWGVPALKGDTSACATEAPCVFSLPPLADSCLSSAANFRHTFSPEQWGQACVVCY